MRLGGYDTTFRRSREDSDFVQRCLHADIELVQTFSANVYHFTCVSSRGKGWFDQQNAEAQSRVQLQQSADRIELNRFIRKWGNFNHGEKKLFKLDMDLVVKNCNHQTILSLEPFFSKVWVENEEQKTSLLSEYKNSLKKKPIERNFRIHVQEEGLRICIKTTQKVNLISDGSGAFKQDGSWVEPYKTSEENPYVQAFWKWWENGLSKDLDELRITGGEPLMSGDTWKLLDWFETQQSSMRFALNSNLIAKKDIIDKLIDKTKNIKDFHLYTSCEAVGAQAEYIRDGLDYNLWKSNLIRIGKEGNLKGLHIMMTINSLCLFSITDFLNEVYEIKEHFGANSPHVSLNLLRFPSFQSPLALPDHIKDYCRKNLEDWYTANKNKSLWTEFEKASIERLIDYLITVDAPHRRTSNRITLWRDFKTFYKEIDA
jgi:hypothetical protein